MFASRFGPLLTTWMSRVKPETLAILGLLREPLAPRRWDGRPDDERAPAVFPGGGDPGEGGGSGSRRRVIVGVRGQRPAMRGRGAACSVGGRLLEHTEHGRGR